MKLRHVLRRGLLFSASLLAVGDMMADSATWSSNPVSGDWNSPDNWMPNTVPNGESDVATFGLSNTTELSFSSKTTVDRMVFNPGADAYTVVTGGAPNFLAFAGAGVINNSGVVQNFVTSLDYFPFHGITFGGDASAGVLTHFTSKVLGVIRFSGNSTAGTGTFTAEGGARAMEGKSFSPILPRPIAQPSRSGVRHTFFILAVNLSFSRARLRLRA